MSSTSAFDIRLIDPTDRSWIQALLQTSWGGTQIVTRGKVHHADRLPGFIAMVGGKPVGLITYQIIDQECEIITLDSFCEGLGIGSALIDTVLQVAVQTGCYRLWLITTNDNLSALRFYQKRGFHLAALHPNAIEHSRKLKPQIPQIGHDGIPIRDEIELEMLL